MFTPRSQYNLKTVSDCSNSCGACAPQCYCKIGLKNVKHILLISQKRFGLPQTFLRDSQAKSFYSNFLKSWLQIRFTYLLKILKVLFIYLMTQTWNRITPIGYRYVSKKNCSEYRLVPVSFICQILCWYEKIQESTLSVKNTGFLFLKVSKFSEPQFLD